MYQIIKSDRGNIILLKQNGVLMSFSEDSKNMDYQKYLAWVADGNSAEIVEPDDES
jgi:hypothetical protein